MHFYLNEQLSSYPYFYHSMFMMTEIKMYKYHIFYKRNMNDFIKISFYFMFISMFNHEVMGNF